MIVPEGYLSMEQAGRRLGVTAETVRALVRGGSLNAVLPYGRERGMLVSERELRDFCEGFRPVSHSQRRG